MIDWVKTKAKYGYTEADLPPTSKNKVICHCDNNFCQAPLDVREREYEFKYAKKKRDKAQAEGAQELCQLCSHAHRKGHASTKKTNSALPLPPEASDELTFKEFGYTASSLSPWSRSPVILVYVNEAGEQSLHTVKRAQLNTNKSVMESGHYKPIAAYTKERRTNIKVTGETKELMKKSQSMRRVREKVEQEQLRAKRLNELLKKTA